MESLSAQRRKKKKEGKHEGTGGWSGERWSAIEDAKLCEQVAIHGSFPNWKKIAKQFPTRSRNSCRYRWEKLSRGQETSLRPPPGFPPMTSLMNPRPPYNWGGCGGLPWNIIMQWLPPPSVGYDYRKSGGEEVMNIEGGERSTTLWIPKPLRVDDPDHEAIKSSIWETLGIKNEKGVGVAGYINGGGGIFKAFQSKKKPST